MALSHEISVPGDLKPGMIVDTPGGTWKMERTGLLDLSKFTIFEANEHDVKPKNIYPRVEDINAYTSSILEEEMNPIPEVEMKTVRKPLSVRRLASLLPTILG